jgi:transcriptional regulator with XRE-family HTH domain
MKKIKLKIDAEFHSLIPPLSKDEYDGLEKSLLRYGCRHSLDVWGEIIIDGHNRFEICNKHSIAYKTKQISFKDRDEAKAWIIRNQFNRRNLNVFQRSDLALKLEAILVPEAKQRMLTGKKLDPTQKSAEGEVRQEIAKAAGVSHDTVSRVKKIKNSASKETIEKLEKGEMSINQAYEIITEPLLRIKPKEPKEPKKLPMLDDFIKEVCGLMNDLFKKLYQIKKDEGINNIQSSRLREIFIRDGKELKELFSEIFREDKK